MTLCREQEDSAAKTIPCIWWLNNGKRFIEA